MQLIQMQLSRKQKTFPEFLSAILEFRLNFKYSEKQGDPQGFSILETTDCETRG